MARIVLVALVACLGVLAHPAQAREPGIEKVSVALTWASVRGQYGKVWPLLHPRYQRVTTRAFWESCQRKRARASAGVEWLSLRATDSYSDRVVLPLLGQRPVVAVSLEAKVRYLGQRHTVRETIYWMKLKGSWRGTWTAEQYRAYRAKRCPD